MRMNQQFRQRQNGFGPKQKISKTNDSGNSSHGQRNQSANSTENKQAFKPVTILKRGDPSGTTIVTKDENQSKENIGTNGQSSKPVSYRQIVGQTVSTPIILLSSKATGNVSPTVPSPGNTVSVPTNLQPAAPPTPTVQNVVHRTSGPIHLTRSSTNICSPVLTSSQLDQHVQSINNRLFSSSTVMKSSSKLLDENLSWSENGQLNNYLQDSDGFIVIGAIGREKVGKSTVLSLLGGNQFIDEDRLMIFPAAQAGSTKTTRGVDIYITNEQTILLDTQPLLSSQFHHQQLTQNPNSTNANYVPHLWQQKFDPRTMFVDNILELQTLEIIAFILAVCHVVLVIEDQFADPYLYRLIQLAEVLRPLIKKNSNEFVHAHSPHLVFILNKCQNYLSPVEQQLIKRTLAQIMVDTNFQIYSSLKSNKKIQIQTNLNSVVNDFKQKQLNENLLLRLLQQSTEDNEFSSNIDEEIEQKHENVNAVFVPRRDFRDTHSSHGQRRFLGFSNADSIVRQLRQQLLAIDRPHMEQCQNQRAWLAQAAKIWDLITKSSQIIQLAFIEYLQHTNNSDQFNLNLEILAKKRIQWIRIKESVVDKRSTTVMLLVASVAFLLLLGPFYIHWCMTYLFFNYSQCHFTRNLYENVQICMGVFHPYLTVIEKGMRESNHAINFLLYWTTSKRFRKDFKRLGRQLIYRVCGSAVVFLYKHICFFFPEPSCLTALERHVSDTTDQESSYESNRKNQTAYKTAHYYSNFERRRQQQLVQMSLLNHDETTTTGTVLLSNLTAKTIRTLEINQHDPIVQQINRKKFSISENV